MQIIIPMTGYGTRFAAAGYRDLKPFIKILGKTVLQWIVEDMFPGEKDIRFICRKEHLDRDPAMESRLRSIAPTAKIHVVADSIKKGPVYDVMRFAETYDADKPTVINYCDFYMTWDWRRFKRQVAARKCEGCIPCYTGFHPHLMPRDNLYASCRIDENESLLEIREKYSFTEDKTLCRHSPGTYYFRSAKIMEKYCRRAIDRNIHLNGEFYASLPYNGLVEDGLDVWVPANVEYFCQWGTPRDMEEFNFWMKTLTAGGTRETVRKAA